MPKSKFKNSKTKRTSRKKNSHKKKNLDKEVSKYLEKRIGNHNILSINQNNNSNLNYDDKKFSKFLNKMLNILNYSFEREREYHIRNGHYPLGYKHNIDVIKNNLNNNKYETLILTNKKYDPISFLYIEKNDLDYDKIWTVCTDKKYRGQGMSSKLLNYMINKQNNNNRNRLLLEVYNDNSIGRKDNDPRQEQIMGLFSNNGFKYVPHNSLPYLTQMNLLTKEGEGKIMIYQ